MIDLLTASKKMGQYSCLNYNIIKESYTQESYRRYGNSLESIMSTSQLSSELVFSNNIQNIFENLLTSTVNFDIEKIWEDPENNCSRGSTNNSCRVRKPTVIKYWNNPSILSLGTMKIKFKTNINLAELIVWWNWVIILGGNTFCGTLTRVLRGEIKTEDYTFWRIILYNLLNVPFQGINSIRDQLKMELDTSDYQLFKSNEKMTLLTQTDDVPVPEEKYLYRSERYINGNHWLMDQLLKIPQFLELKDKDLELADDGSKVYISQCSVISTTYNLNFAKSWVKGEIKSVIYIIKGEIDANGDVTLINGSPWEIEMYGPTRQSEIILSPCMYLVDKWYEEIVNGKTICYIELYVLRDFKELIINNIITNHTVGENISLVQKKKIIKLMLLYLNENERGTNFFDSFNRKMQEILNIIINRINSLKELSNPELFEIMKILGRSDSKNYREFIEALKNITPTEDLTPSMNEPELDDS